MAETITVNEIRIFSLDYLAACVHPPAIYTDVVIRIIGVKDNTIFVWYNIAPTHRQRGRIVFVE